MEYINLGYCGEVGPVSKPRGVNNGYCEIEYAMVECIKTVW